MGIETALIGGALASGGLGFLGNKMASDAQQDAASSANALQKYIYQQNRADLEPWRNTGVRSLSALQYELGLGPSPTAYHPGNLAISAVAAAPGTSPGPTQGPVPGQTGWQHPDYVPPGTTGIPGAAVPGQQYKVGDRTFASLAEAKAFVDAERAKRNTSFDYRGFEATPGYEFLRTEGEKAIHRANAATGSFFSGPMAKDLSRFNTGLAAQEYNNYLNRLQAAAGLGQNTTTTLAGLGQNYAAQVGQNTINAGQARATGYENMFGGVNQTIGNLAGLYSQYKLGGFAPVPQQSPFLPGSGVY